MRRILVATDGSPGADRAVDLAATLAKSMGSELHIVTIAGDIADEQEKLLARAEGGIGAVIEAFSAQILRKAKERAQRLGASTIETTSGWGDAAQCILDIAARKEADAIVLGRRGRGRLAGLLLGSVSQKIVSLAPCPVIVVP
jgi:nucleotide-binding universal stress UspA family protein